MTGRIYLLQDNSDLMAMEEAPYDSEKLLQELLAKHPDLLAGEQINSEDPRRWLLVTREMAVQGEEEGAARWSLDHLFLDQEAIPTLVEVKKGSSTDIRRKVIGQMLDYAANAVAYWPVEEIRAKFESRCQKSGENPDEQLAELLDDDQSTEDFWYRVKTNLQAGRIRMVFLADIIPAELRRVVEFLNEQMDPAEVLAIEVKQFLGEGMKTLVPRIVGQTEAARQKKSGGTRSNNQWDETAFMSALQETAGDSARAIAEDLLNWIKPQVSYIHWGRGAQEGGFIPTIDRNTVRHHVCRVTTSGWIVFKFDEFKSKAPLDSDSLRRDLLQKINEIPSAEFNDDFLTKRVRIRMEQLSHPEDVPKLKEVVQWIVDRVNEAPST